LARALAAVGDAPAAIVALERQIDILRAKADSLGEARAHGRIGTLWEAVGDDGLAQASYVRALELEPRDVDIAERLAAVTARRGNVDEAIARYAWLADHAGADAARARRARRELARLHLARKDYAAARVELFRATGGEDAERIELLSHIEEAEGNLAAAVALLDDIEPAAE